MIMVCHLFLGAGLWTVLNLWGDRNTNCLLCVIENERLVVWVRGACASAGLVSTEMFSLSLSHGL